MGWQSAGRGVRLPMREVVRDALRVISARWRALLRALVLPAVVCSIPSVVSVGLIKSDPKLAISLMLVSVPLVTGAYALIAVSCHRIVLSGVDAIPNSWSLYWTRRELRFLGRMIEIGVLSFVPTAIAAGVVSVTMHSRLEPRGDVMMAIYAVISVPGSCLWARWAFAFPVMALGGRCTRSQAWARQGRSLPRP